MKKREGDPATELGGRLSRLEVKILFKQMRENRNNAPAQSAGVKAPTKEKVKLA